MSWKSRCLTVDELEELITAGSTAADQEGSPLSSLAKLSEDWEVELIGATYFLTQVVLRRASSDQRWHDLLEAFESLTDRMWFTIEQMDVDFVDFILRNRRESELTLQENLIRCIESMRDYRYEKTVRL